ncbi:hypothetical protein V1264_022750 [Littorina saxatilis]|uniref:Uncharacterized protein n=3 Tax=Littorina saxatilis TaxID=31220 RepID=A0AAN9B6F4_9CAEN
MGRGGASGMEGGGSAWRSPCNQRCVTTAWYRLLISIMFRLLLLSILLQARYIGPQRMGLYVLESCVGNPQLNNTGLPGNFNFIAGCTARVNCKYLNVTEDYCSKRDTTDLAVTPCIKPIPACDFPNRSLILSSMVEVQKTKCNIIVDIQNITTQFDGGFTCVDGDYPGVERFRNVNVGGVPETPQNLSFVYELSGNIVLWLDPVKQGYELNDNHTTWNIRFDWLNSIQTCSKKSDSECKQLNPEGLCQPCFIKLNKYEGCGQYASQGSVFNKINFTISVTNKFATVPAVIQSFFSPDWIKPGPVSSILIQKINGSQFSLEVEGPKGFDQCHFREIKTESNKPVYNYTVDLVSLREQSLLQNKGKLFYETYGFVRNLEDDELALSQTDHSAFSQHEMYMWESNRKNVKAKKLKPQKKVITGLPFAGYWYNISVQTKAHYWGKTIWVKEMTSETAPRKGPQLDDNFAYCSLINESCAVCLIYFKEIPRIQRGSAVLNHSLSLTLLNEDIGMQSKCGNSRIEETTGGHNNTFRVVGLAVGGVYNISLRASTSEGWSPNTTAVLHVLPSPPTFAAQDIVLESSGSSYDLSWKPGRIPENTQLRYIVHNCSAIALQLFPDGGYSGGNESTLPTVPLNCVTNMASKELSENHTNSLTFDDVPRDRGLTPVFFLSTVTPTNLISGLLPVDCFYTKSRVPEKVKSLDVQVMENDPSHVKVKFQLPCGQDLDYNYGRPDRYGIGVEKDDGSVKCSKRMTGSGLRYQISGNLTETVEYDKMGLEHDSNYCVCVYLFARNDVFRQNEGFCKTFKTGTEPESTFPVWLIVTLAAIVGIVFLICAIW